MDSILLKELAYKSLLELSHEEGFSASGKEEIYGCIFGRDTALTVLKILKAHKKTALPELVAASRRALLTLTRLQGKTINIESGEEPGKFIHEFRRNKFDHLINSKKPWYVYPEGVLKNYDSIDSTPLALIAIYRFWEATDDEEFMHLTTPAVKAGLKWIITTGDRDHDYFLEYEVPSQRVHGGLTIHSWTDSTESLLTSQGTFPVYPIAPVEAQSYAWLALKLWANYFKAKNPCFPYPWKPTQRILKAPSISTSFSKKRDTILPAKL